MPVAPVIDLSFLDAVTAFVITGGSSRDYAGRSVSNAGDINGDGIDDLIVGADGVDHGGSGSGKAYVIFGKAGTTRDNIVLNNLAPSEGFSIQGHTDNDRAGFSVSNAGDVNGDGIDDLIIGAFGSDIGGSYAGAAYVVYGKVGATRANIDLTSLASGDGFVIVGDTAGDRAGFSVSGAGDVNGDGLDDLIVGARYGDDGGSDAGEAYIIFGKAGTTRTVVDLTGLSGGDGFIVRGDAANRQAGFSVSNAGDVNGDGIEDVIIGVPSGDDLIVGAPRDDFPGASYVIFGKSGTSRANIDLATLAPGDGFIIRGDLANDLVGTSVSAAGDINGDGIDDLVVGAPKGDNGGISAGEAYVIFGKAAATRANIDLATLNASDGFIIQGDTRDDQAGFSVSSAGDIDGDGIDDLIVAAPYGELGGNLAGQVYVVFGKAGATRANIDLSTLTDSEGIVIRGDEGRDFTGRSVSGAGDINGDGVDDLLVGVAFGERGYSYNSGEVYVIYGSRRFGGLNGTVASETLTGTAGTDQINGEGGDDLLLGGGGEDIFNGGAGNDIVVVDSAGDVVNERAGEGVDSVETNLASYTLTANVENLEYTGAGVFNGTGNAVANIIVGGAMGDVLSGLDGNDTLGGEEGDDILDGGDGNDRLNGGIDVDTMNGGAGDDILIVDDAGDVANGGDGVDTLQFTAVALTYTVASDIEIVTNATGSRSVVDITLNALANTYGGGRGGDLVTAGDGADILYGRAGNDILIGEGGNDRLFGDTGGDSLFGGDGDDLLYAGADVDEVLGGAGNDTIYGEAGNDIIRGGDGVDQLFGGTGSDRFLFNAGETGTTLATADRIRDFSQSGDRIDLQIFDAIDGGGNDAFTFIGSGAFTGVAGQLRSVISGGQTLVSGDVNGDGVADFLIRVDGAMALTQADFIL